MTAYDPRYPTVDDLRLLARKRIPRFAFEYLDGGCNEEVNLLRNTEDIRQVELIPQYLTEHRESSLQTELFGRTYDAPFGVAPMGLQGMLWPGAAEILARASVDHNIPFVLSTVTTSSIERIAEITEGQAWFQLYHPTEDQHRDDIIRRAEKAGFPVLVVICDVPVIGFRPRDIRNGLSMPPRMTFRNILQMLARPTWTLQTLKAGRPQFESLTAYMPKSLNLAQLGEFMSKMFSGRLNEEKIKPIREMWPGKLVLKGVASEEDAERAIHLGLDGIIVSNHGGRQLDAGQSSIKALKSIAANYGDKITVMMDSGLRSGPDIARTVACGARFTFLGRAFMYGVSALGPRGGDHTMTILKHQLQQVMEQTCCRCVEDLTERIAK